MKDLGQNEIVHHFLTSKSGLGLGNKPVLKEMLIIANYNSDETKNQNVQRNFMLYFYLSFLAQLGYPWSCPLFLSGVTPGGGLRGRQHRSHVLQLDHMHRRLPEA